MLKVKGWINKYVGQEIDVLKICHLEKKTINDFLLECKRLGIPPQVFHFNPSKHKDVSTHWILKYIGSGNTLQEISKYEKLTESDILVALLNVGKSQSDLILKGNFMIGLDVGTSRLLSAFVGASANPHFTEIKVKAQRNAFIELDINDSTLRALKRQKVNYVIVGKKAYIVGDNAYDFGNVFPHQELKRPMAHGTLSIEPSALPVLRELIGALIGSSTTNSVCAYSVPAAPVDIHKLVQYHSDVIESIISSYGYKPLQINEAVAVANIGLEDYDQTGLAFSFGGGLINMALLYKGLSALQLSVSQAGDFIDGMSARDLGLAPIQVNALKESDVIDISKEQTTREGQAIKSYYILCIRHALAEIAKFFGKTEKMPHFAEPIHVACAGGGVIIPGFAECFEREFRALEMPFKLVDKGVHIVNDPLTAVARGCLIEAELS